AALAGRAAAAHVVAVDGAAAPVADDAALGVRRGAQLVERLGDAGRLADVERRVARLAGAALPAVHLVRGVLGIPATVPHRAAFPAEADLGGRRPARDARVRVGVALLAVRARAAVDELAAAVADLAARRAELLARQTRWRTRVGGHVAHVAG